MTAGGGARPDGAGAPTAAVVERARSRRAALWAVAAMGALAVGGVLTITGGGLGRSGAGTTTPSPPGLTDVPGLLDDRLADGTAPVDPARVEGASTPDGEVPAGLRGLEILVMDGSFTRVPYGLVLGAESEVREADVLDRDEVAPSAVTMASIEIGGWGTLVHLEDGGAWSLPAGALGDSVLVAGDTEQPAERPAVVAGPDAPRLIAPDGLAALGDPPTPSIVLPPDVTPIRVLSADPPAVVVMLDGTQELYVLQGDRHDLVGRGVVAGRGAVGQAGMLLVSCEPSDCGVRAVAWDGTQVPADDAVTQIVLAGGDVAVSPDGRRAVLVSHEIGKIVMVDLTTGRVTVTWTEGGTVSGVPGPGVIDDVGPPAWEPSGRYVLLPGGPHGVVVLDAFLGGVTVVPVALPSGGSIAAVVPVVR